MNIHSNHSKELVPVLLSIPEINLLAACAHQMDPQERTKMRDAVGNQLNQALNEILKLNSPTSTN